METRYFNTMNSSSLQKILQTTNEANSSKNVCRESSASCCRCHWKDWGCFPKYTVEENKHINIIMAAYEKYSQGNFFSLYSQQMGRVSVAFPSTLQDWILQGSFFFLFQNVLFFYPKGILNQAKNDTWIYSFFPSPQDSSSFFWIGWVYSEMT